MIAVYFNPDHILHNPVYELYDGLKAPYAEKADRIKAIIEGVKDFGIEPNEVKIEISQKYLLKVHDEKYVRYIKEKSLSVNDRKQIIPSYFISDTYTPITRHTYTVASHSAGLALYSAQKLLEQPENIIYALCRPPGHHAELESMGGYCYFNNASIAAEKLSENGKVAIIDLDYHHGNGTQKNFYSRDDVLYVSLHAHPKSAFPYLSGFTEEVGEGKGVGFNINYPLDPSIDNKNYVACLKRAILRIQDFKPDFIVVSMGYDTFYEDPIGGMGLTEEVYETIGSMLVDVGRPLIIIQEGGYNIESLRELVYSFLKGLNTIKA